MNKNNQEIIKSALFVFSIIIIVASFFVPDNLKIGAFYLDVVIVIVWTCIPSARNPQEN